MNKYKRDFQKYLRNSLSIKDVLLRVAFFLALLQFIFVLSITVEERKVGNIIIRNLKSYETVEYRGARFTYYKKEFPEDKLYIFYTVVDSLIDDIKPKYAIGQYPMDIYLYKKSLLKRYNLDFYNEDNVLAFADESSRSIYLQPLIFESGSTDGDFAMLLLHEYTHIVQYGNHDFLSDYSEKVGWNVEASDRQDTFSKVLSSYSLTNAKEDMAESIMLSYLCGNNLSALSEERLEFVLNFWSIPRQEFCRNFPQQ